MRPICIDQWVMGGWGGRLRWPRQMTGCAVLITVLLAAAGEAAASVSYLGMGVGQTDLEMTPCSDVSDGSFAVCREDHNNTGYKIFAGRHLTDTLAIEVGYVELGRRMLDFTSDGTGLIFQMGRYHGVAKTHGYYLQGVSSSEVFPGITVQAMFGLVRADTQTMMTLNNVAAYSASSTATDIKFGVGMEMMLSERVAVRADLETLKDIYRDIVVPDSQAGRDADLYTLNILYRLP